MRKAAQIAGAAAMAALLLSACGSGGGSGEGNAKDGGSTAPSAPQSAPAGDGKPASAVEGAWETKADGERLILVVMKGTASLSEGHKTACIGKVQELGGVTAAAFKCTKGGTTRTMGTLKPAADGSSLTVKWKDGPTDTFTKSTDGKVKLPDLPQLPSGIPSDLPTVPGTN